MARIKPCVLKPAKFLQVPRSKKPLSYYPDYQRLRDYLGPVKQVIEIKYMEIELENSMVSTSLTIPS
jgi:hypothetical protein